MTKRCLKSLLAEYSKLENLGDNRTMDQDTLMQELYERINKLMFG